MTPRHRITIPCTKTNRPLNPAQTPITLTTITVGSKLRDLALAHTTNRYTAAIARSFRVGDDGAVFTRGDGEGVAGAVGGGPGFRVIDGESRAKIVGDEG
jgi:hypothetical protein